MSRRPRSLELPIGMLTDDVQSVIRDPQIDVATELMGGLKPTSEIFLALLECGKDVVTANKALLCEHGDVLFDKARTLGRTVAFEAAVAGGIPIIACINQSLTANQITGIEAILNGTSNFILTEMFARDRPYRPSPHRGPAAWICRDRPDAGYRRNRCRAKAGILAQLAFGTKVNVRRVHAAGDRHAGIGRPQVCG